MQNKRHLKIHMLLKLPKISKGTSKNERTRLLDIIDHHEHVVFSVWKLDLSLSSDTHCCPLLKIGLSHVCPYSPILRHLNPVYWYFFYVFMWSSSISVCLYSSSHSKDLDRSSLALATWPAQFHFNVVILSIISTNPDLLRMTILGILSGSVTPNIVRFIALASLLFLQIAICASLLLC